MLTKAAQPRLRFLSADAGEIKQGWILETPYAFSPAEMSRAVQFCAKAHYAKFRMKADKGDMREWIDKLRTFIVDDGAAIVWDTIHPLPVTAVPAYVEQRVVGERGDSLGDITLFKSKYEKTKNIIDLGAR